MTFDKEKLKISIPNSDMVTEISFILFYKEKSRIKKVKFDGHNLNQKDYVKIITVNMSKYMK